MDAILRSPEAAKPTLRLVGVRAVLRDVLDTVIDAPGIVGGMQNVPRRRLVSRDDSARCDPLADQRDSGGLARHDEWQRATADLARHNHDLALARLFFG